MYNYLEDHINYKFENCLANFRDELLFKGVTYYDRLMVFQHLIPYRRKEFYNLEISSIELTFKREKLVSVLFHFNDQKIDTILKTVQKIIKNDFKVPENKIEIRTPYQTKYYTCWSDFIIAIGEKGNNQFLYFTIKEHNHLHINDGEIL